MSYENSRGKLLYFFQIVNTKKIKNIQKIQTLQDEKLA